MKKSPRRRRNQAALAIASALLLVALVFSWLAPNRSSQTPIEGTQISQPPTEPVVRPAPEEAAAGRNAAEPNPPGVQANAAAPVANRPPVPATLKLEPPQGAVKMRSTALLGSDPDGDPLSLAGIDPSSARGGSVTVRGDWIFYQAPDGLTGEDSIRYVVRDEHGAVATGTVSLVLKSDSAAINVKPTSNLVPGEGVRVADNGIPGRTYTIEFAEDSSSPEWRQLGTTVADASGSYAFLDRTAVAAGKRIYRVRTY